MRKSKSQFMAERSFEVLTAAVGVYNRPSEPYRIERFTILVCNAWELLLKARILQLNKNNFSSIAVYQQRQNADGKPSVKRYRKKTRSGSTMTIDMMAAFKRLNDKNAEKLPDAVRVNLEAIAEVRDTAIHFIHTSDSLALEQHEVFAAAASNFLTLIKRWFGFDIAKSGPHFLPLAFLSSRPVVTAHGPEKKLIGFLKDCKNMQAADDSSQFSVGLYVHVDAKKSNSSEAAAYRLTRDQDAPALRVEEDALRDQFPWTYSQVVSRCRSRYTNFSQNHVFHKVMKEVKADPTLHHRRLLDAKRPSGAGKDYYSPNLWRVLDNHWTRRDANLSA